MRLGRTWLFYGAQKTFFLENKAGSDEDACCTHKPVRPKLELPQNQEWDPLTGRDGQENNDDFIEWTTGICAASKRWCSWIGAHDFELKVYGPETTEYQGYLWIGNGVAVAIAAVRSLNSRHTHWIASMPIKHGSSGYCLWFCTCLQQWNEKCKLFLNATVIISSCDGGTCDWNTWRPNNVFLSGSFPKLDFGSGE